ncbi:RNA polymerase sigma factor [Rhodovulum sp. DZ06]|uniref:RNA polymerase sigma factor n=1 Tax=Rhodovulum sp. DZ06 TaxID=3425126 RepID=UPI003D3403FC
MGTPGDQPGDADDRLLLARIARGDKAAMRALYERHHDALFAFARLRAGDEAAAADAVQDAMLEVWRKAGAFSGRSAARTWIFAIARNKLVDRARRSGRLSFTDETPERADEAPGPAAVLEAAQDAARVRACLARLTEAQRAAVRLAFFEDLPYPDVAAREGVPVGTVKTRIHHAKKALMRCLGRPG